MKITSIEILRLGSDPLDVIPIPWNPTIVKVNTDEGLYGLGEIGLAMGAAEHGQMGLARDFAKLLIGEDPFAVEAIWEKLYRRTFWGMGGGVLIFSVMSAIDVALWDLKGKALEVPVYELLGGKTHDRLRTYASQIQFEWDAVSAPRVTPEQLAESTVKAMEDGYDAVKVNPLGYDLDGNWMTWNTHGFLTKEQIRTAAARTAAVREAGGEDLDILIELHCHTDAVSAVQLGKGLEEYGCTFLEEATAPLNWKNMKEIADRVDIPIATGERLWSRWGFRPYIENQAVHMIQPDIGVAGGITETKKIADMANVYDIGVQAHLCGSPIAIAAALQLEAVLPNFVIHEHNNQSLAQLNIDFCVNDYQPKDGYFEIPNLPGIGQDLTEQAYRDAERVVVS